MHLTVKLTDVPVYRYINFVCAGVPQVKTVAGYAIISARSSFSVPLTGTLDLVHAQKPKIRHVFDRLTPIRAVVSPLNPPLNPYIVSRSSFFISHR